MFPLPASMGIDSFVPGGAPAANRVAVANNCNFPVTYATGANWVQNCWTTHKSGPQDCSSIEVTFLNGLISTNSEQDAFYDFYLDCGLYLNGTFYQGLSGGNPTATVSKSWGTAVFTFNVTIPANTRFIITNRRVATDGGVAGSYNVITTTGGITERQDGIISGTDNTKNYTLGVGVAYGAANNRVTAGQISAGAVTGVTRATGGGGHNYTAGLNIAAWYGPAGAGQPGATIPGSGVTGYGNSSGGLYTTTSITSGGSGHSAGNPPYIFMGGTGVASSGFGTTTATYGPTLITGIPANPTPSVMLHGDSMTIGYTSADPKGDLDGNYGFYEQTLGNLYGVFKMAVSGESAAGWIATHTKQLAFIDAAIARGLTISHVILALGTNDFLTNTNSNVLTVTEGYIGQIIAIWQARGAKVIVCTVAPANTTSSGSNKFTTILEQSPYNTNYTLGSKVDQYNTRVIANTGPTNDGYIDGRSQMQDATTTTAWRVDCYGGATAFCAVDGIHPSAGVGIAFLKANMSIPVLSV